LILLSRYKLTSKPLDNSKSAQGRLPGQTTSLSMVDAGHPSSPQKLV
jgi:hypothetical protein